ncbi:MAG TPA: TIGR03862 family flavoprotein [Gammaproteobacteria bacterium]|nr:TIGR03862 family flavoprotein [Gammaproteobacteria bacterium]
MGSGNNSPRTVAIIGGGPAGLMAAEAAVERGAHVDLYDAMASAGRKFLLAGKGGLNLTHSDPPDLFLSRYGARRAQLAPLLKDFGPTELREWVKSLGIGTFVGSSGRVFPADMKAAPLLRAWLRRLRSRGVTFHMRHRWCGWNTDGALRFATPENVRSVRADTVVLALGGGSWPKLGSDGAWVPWLTERGVRIEPLRPANCGFDVHWSEHFRTRFAGQPVKSVTVSFTESNGTAHRQPGEFVVTANGIEGGVIYALSGRLRDQIAATGSARIELDLAPGRELERLVSELSQPRGSRSMASHLKRRAGIDGVKAGLLRVVVPKDSFNYPAHLAKAIKALPLQLIAPRPLSEAISTAGGVAFDELDENLMLRRLPGVFCAGEMLDWEAPTGGYLLTACFASGRIAGHAAVACVAAKLR